MEELKRFLLIAQQRNLTKVADQIFITQSALTQSIQKLERRIGAKLFTQKGKHLELTPDGQALIPIAEKILNLWQRALDPKIRKTIKPTITIGMFDNAALRLAKFIQQQTPSPNYSLEFVIERSGKLLTDLKLGVLDIAIAVIDPNSKHSNEITCLHTFNEELLPVSSKTFKQPIQKIPFILYNKTSHTRSQIDQAFQTHNITPTIQTESTSDTLIKQLALLGTGLALLPENLIQHELRQKLLKPQPIQPKFTRQYAIFIQKNNNLEEIKIIKDQITQILQTRAP
jgi:DNA-binding transcriptional LysR family regulator